MKEITSEREIAGQLYLIDEISDIGDKDGMLYRRNPNTWYQLKLGAPVTAKILEYSKLGYSGTIMIPDNEIADILRKDELIEQFVLLHEAGHCQPGGLPNTQIEYEENSLQYELIADNYVIENIGAKNCLLGFDDFFHEYILYFTKHYKDADISTDEFCVLLAKIAKNMGERRKNICKSLPENTSEATEQPEDLYI